MKENEVKQYIGKVVTVHYRTPDDGLDSVHGEVLAVDQGVLCLGVNIYRPTPGSDRVLRLRENDLIKLVDISVVECIELIPEKATHSVDFMTVGNCARYCASIFESIYFKSISDPTDFFAASNYYLHAMKSGFVTDEIMGQYLKTMWCYLTTIRGDKDNGDEELYGYELKNRLRCLEEFSKFMASDRNVFQYLSVYQLNAILTKLFNLKRFAYSHEVACVVFSRYPLALLTSEEGIRKLLKEPKTCGSALVFAVQSENLYCQAMAANADKHGDRNQWSEYKKMEKDLNELMETAKANIDSIRKTEGTSISDKDGEQLTNMEENIEAYFNHVNSKRDFLDDKSTIFQFIFNNLKKEIAKADQDKKVSLKPNDPLFIASLKSRYDKAMAQLYNLYRFIGLFKKPADEENESRWQIALELMQLYSKKLNLISDQKEKEAYRVAKQDAIKTDILDRLRVVPNDVNYFKNCPHSKLVPISEYLYEFNLLDAYIAISKVIDYSSHAGIKPVHKTLCSLRVAEIYSSREDEGRFKKNYDVAKVKFDSLNGSDRKEEFEECRELYSSLTAKYTTGLLAWIEFRNQLSILLKKLKTCSGDTELKNLRSEFNKLCDENEDVFASDSYKEFENDVHGERTIDLLSKILVYIDSSKDFRMANNIQQKTGISFDQNRLEDMAMKRSEIKMRRSKKTVTVRENLVADWKAWIKDSNKVFRNSDKGGSYEKTNEYQKTKYYNNLNSDYYDSLSVDEKVSGLLDAILRWNFPTAAKWMQKNISLIIITAKRQHIQNIQRFHDILISYCEIDMNQSEKSGSTRISIPRACRLMAENPSVSEDLNTRKRYCEIGMLNCKETFTDENGNEIKSIDYSKLKDLLEELNSAPVTKLDNLRKKHKPQFTIDFLYRQFVPDLSTSSVKLKYLTHDDGSRGDNGYYKDQLERMRKSFREDVRLARERNEFIPLSLEHGIRIFLGDVEADVKKVREEYRILGWSKRSWKEWLEDNPNAINPKNRDEGFPYQEEIEDFRKMYRIEGFKQLSDICIRCVKAVETEISTKEISTKIDVEIRDITERRSRFDDGYNYYGWMPLISDALERILKDIVQRAKTGNTTPKVGVAIDMKKGQLFITHKASEPKQPAEKFLKKLEEGGGALYEIADTCCGICDYHVIANWYPGKNDRDAKVMKKIHILNSIEPKIEIVEPNMPFEGFTHVLSFYTNS